MHHMHASLLRVLSELSQKDVNGLYRPTQGSGQERKFETFLTLEYLKEAVLH